MNRYGRTLSRAFIGISAAATFLCIPITTRANVVSCGIGGGTSPPGWTLDGVGGGVGAAITPFIPPGGAATDCVIVTDTGSGVGTTPTAFLPSNIPITGITNGSQMTSPAFAAKSGDKLHFQFMFFSNDGTGDFSDVARAALINPTTNAPVLDLFTARTGQANKVVPGYGFSTLPAGLVLTPATSTLIGDTFTLGDFGTGNGATTYGPSRYGGGPGGSSSWVDAVFSFDQSTAGTYKLQMSVANVGDQIYSSGLAFTGQAPSSPPPPSTPPLSATQLAFPLKGNVAVYLVTQAGGLSSDNSVPKKYQDHPQDYAPCGIKIGAAYFDPCHEPNKGNYAIDLVSTDATVVAAKGGVVVQLYGANSLSSGVTNKCDVQNCIVIKDSNGLYEEYREFSSIETFHLGESISVGQTLGALQGGSHLHFQVEALVNDQLNSKSCDYVPDNCSSILQNVTVGGRLFKDYRLDGDGKVVPNTDGSFNSNELTGKPIKSQIFGQTNPLLPTTSDQNLNAFKFNVVIGDLGIGLNLPIYVDPAVAIGYDYQVFSGPNFASVLLPHVGDGLFDLLLFDSILSNWFFDQTLQAGTQFFFDPGGVDRFRIMGIEQSAGLDPNNPNAFVTGLTFTGAGNVDFSMTAIGNANAVAEPGSAILLITALGCLLLVQRRRGAGRKCVMRCAQWVGPGFRAA